MAKSRLRDGTEHAISVQTLLSNMTYSRCAILWCVTIFGLTWVLALFLDWIIRIENSSSASTEICQNGTRSPECKTIYPFSVFLCHGRDIYCYRDLDTIIWYIQETKRKIGSRNRELRNIGGKITMKTGPRETTSGSRNRSFWEIEGSRNRSCTVIIQHGETSETTVHFYARPTSLNSRDSSDPAKICFAPTPIVFKTTRLPRLHATRNCIILKMIHFQNYLGFFLSLPSKRKA